MSAEQLADALWSDAPPAASWGKVVQGCVVRLRKVLGAATIATVQGGYRLTVAADGIDASRFKRLVARAQELLRLDEPDRAASLFDDALGLWRGRAVVDLDAWEAGCIEAHRLEELRRDAEGCGSRPGCGRGASRRCWPRRRPGVA